MTPADIIVDVRRMVQDTNPPYRYSDADMLGYVNQVLKRMAVIRPDLFAAISDITPVAGAAYQTLPTGALRLMDIFQVKGGNAVSEVDRETLSRSYPGWMAEAPAAPVNYMRHPKDPVRYFLYPRPIAGTVLVGEYATTPATYTAGSTITELPDSYLPAVVDGVVFLVEVVDAEHAETGRAKIFYDSFVAQLTASLQSRVITDTKSAGLPVKEVI